MCKKTFNAAVFVAMGSEDSSATISGRMCIRFCDSTFHALSHPHPNDCLNSGTFSLGSG
jgi:hypothetical protein